MWLCRSLLTQEGICMQLQPNFHFLEVAYPYVARRLLTDEDPALRERLFQVFILHRALVSVLTFLAGMQPTSQPLIDQAVLAAL